MKNQFNYCANVLDCKNEHRWNSDAFINGKDLASTLRPTLCSHCEAIFNATHQEIVYARKWVGLKNKIRHQLKRIELSKL